ncbi:serine/threonine protein kinase [Streptomyces sp. TRM66268-LWL]|uniref:Serine/threonine protein kinase n=1 Tax=Streptomyces polyasparticus TaxID=2767826 RepID=A0ABR7S8K2_9ACTN|nr:serine/threonine protein kinase [Streptomyces polyasparticus]MBC9711753.1 serine/threonine protein kinase [Streptomyces polyasparticus]
MQSGSRAGHGTGVQWIGPYAVLAALDASGSGSGRCVPPALRYIGRTPDGERTVLLSSPLPGSDPARFLTEADASRYLVGRWALPATEVAPAGHGAWHASPYLPVLPLPAALALHGGPLPERTVRALGVALAESLSVIHGQGLTHAGVSPAAVLLAHDGPRLGGYGAVRTAAATDGTARRGAAGIDASVLAPEQRAGGVPRPMGDVYALGATLAFAATGSTAPEREELPGWLRPVVTRCLARDPADRLQLVACVRELADGDRAAAQQPAGFGAPERATALLTPGWLPPRIGAALAHQAAIVLGAELDPGAGGAAVAARAAAPSFS